MRLKAGERSGRVIQRVCECHIPIPHQGPELLHLSCPSLQPLRQRSVSPQSMQLKLINVCKREFWLPTALGEGRSTFSTEEATLLFLVPARRAAEKRGVPEKGAEECPVNRHQGMGSV